MSDPSAAVSDTHVEPFVSYYSYEPEAAIRVDGGWDDITEADHGFLVLGLDHSYDISALRATVLEVHDEAGQVLRKADPAVDDLHPRRVRGRWCRLQARPAEDGGQPTLAAAIDAWPDLARPSYEHFEGLELDVTGAVFTDGVRPGIEGDAWMFVVRGHGRLAGGARRQTGRVAPRPAPVGPYLARAYRSGRRDFAERLVGLGALQDRTVALIGLGGVGAPSAIELAKAGLGTLRAVEFDVVEPGNAARWPLGYHAAGRAKTTALGNLLRSHWPYTELQLASWRIGGIRKTGPPEWEGLRTVFGGTDLIFDATAEVGVNYFLSELSKDLGVPYLVASATEGGWGGRVGRFRPDADAACWTCLMHHIQDGTIPSPPADPDAATGRVQPAGCVDPTFTGAGFDIATVSLAAVRLAVSTLCEDVPGAYPPANWDVANFQFRDAEQTYPGTTEQFVVDQHPDCEPCRLRRSG